MGRLLVWFTRLRQIVHVHGLPLLFGAGVGVAFLKAQTSGTVTLNIEWMANQSLLDAVCQYGRVCLSAIEGPQAISTLLVGAFSALIADRLYIAEAPKYPWLAKANDAAEKIVGKVPEVEASFPNDPKPQASAVEGKTGTTVVLGRNQ